jgi:hypothetical protein
MPLPTESNKHHCDSARQNTTTIYYSAMQKTLPEIATQHSSTWQTMTGITEGMKNTRIKYLTGQLPLPKTYTGINSRKHPCAHAAKTPRMAVTMQ